MAISKTKIDEDVFSKFRISFWNVTLDNSYPAGGYGASLGFAPQPFGVSVFLGVHIIGLNAAGSGIVALQFDYTNVKLMAFRVATFTPAGTIAAPVFTGTPMGAHDHDMKVIGGQAAAGTNTVTAPAATDILGKEEAGDADILGADVATKGGVVGGSAGTPAGTNSAPAFTGGAQGQIALAQVTAAVNLSAVSARIMVIGR